MADFTSGFWTWYIVFLTLSGIAGVFWLVWWMTAGSPKITKVEPLSHSWDETLVELNNPLPRWWLIMFYALIVGGLVYLLLYPGLGAYRGLLGWTSTGQYEQEIQTSEETYGPLFDKFLQQDVASLAADPEAMEVGARLFGTYCAACHGSDARGARGFPNLADDDWLHGGAPETIKATIMNGRQGNMPSWEASLGRKGVFQATEYVRSLSGRATSQSAAVAGKAVFQQYCAACHKADGTGNQAMGAPNLTDGIWLYGGSQQRIMESISKGRRGVMPAHKEFPGEAKAHLLAGYVYSLSRAHGEPMAAATAAQGGGDKSL